MQSRIIGIAVAVAMAVGPSVVAAPSFAAEEEDPALEEKLDEAEKAFKDTVASFLRIIEGLVKSIPQYEAPEMLDNGDIIIRRKHPEPEKEEEPSIHETGESEKVL